MRNLQLANQYEVNFKAQGSSLPLSNVAFDNATGALICAFGPSAENPIVDLKRQPTRTYTHWQPETTNGLPQLIASWDAPCPLDDLPHDQVISLHHFSHTQTTCLVFAGGDLILVREQPRADQEKIEIIGSIDVGIVAAQWSPSHDLLAVLTREGSLVLMSQQLEPVAETAFSEEDLRLSKHVSVGWGKKETQFQGKRAKAMRDPTMPEMVDEGKPSAHEDGRSTITWRGDGAYVAVNSFIASSRRVIRVFSREGLLDSVSEPVDGLESAVSWRPHGNLIAGIQRSTIDVDKTKLQVVFFERNGLRHGEFELRLNDEEISTIGRKVCLSWNIDSTILAVQFVDRVQFWTTANYHYYLKQEVQFDGLESLTWSNSSPTRCCISGPEGLRELNMSFEVSRGSTVSPFDYGLVGVIDGKRLKLTPFKHAGPPPPMAYLEVEADAPIIVCAFSRTGQRFAYLTKDSLYLTKWNMQATGKDGSILRHSMRTESKRVALPHPTGACFSEIVIQNDDTVYLLSPARDDGKIFPANCQQLTWVSSTSEDFAASFVNVDISPSAKGITLDSVSEHIWIHDFAALSSLSGALSLTSPLPFSTVVKTADGVHRSVALGAEGRLYLDANLIVNDCTSFAVTEHHLVFTTKQHLLKFAHLTGEDLDIVRDDLSQDERLRSIERDAKLITVIPSLYAVVLQMPRGNIETIFPRVMVLSGIRKHITELDFRSAFLACQKHQIDPNILYDYDPNFFMSNISLFIDKLKKPARVDEFIAKLKDEDVTQKLYFDTSIPSHRDAHTSAGMARPNDPYNPPEKVNKICSAFISTLRTKSSAYLQNAITAHVTKRPPDLRAALQMISTIQQSSTDEADLAIAHLVQQVPNPTHLYDTALSFYDLELALLIAQNDPQSDPREYLPFLRKLQAITPEARRNYTIDNHLKNYTGALTHLHTLDAHEEAEAYTVKYSLYITATRLYQYQPTYLQRILRLHAQYLTESKSAHKAAATIFESLGDYEEAYPLYALAHSWRESLTCASLVEPELTKDKLNSLASQLATTLTEENRDYRSAATIHLEYLSDIPTAARTLCKGSYFAEAMRILSHNSLRAQIPEIIDPLLRSQTSDLLELFSTFASQLTSQVPRIVELRVKKAQDPLAFYGGDAANPDDPNAPDIPDNLSLAATDASTLAGKSMFTRYGGGAGTAAGSAAGKFAGTVASGMSRKTSKTRRREERKRARGKKGSVYEEEYIVASVARLLERVNGTHDEVARLVSGLLRRGMRELAIRVEEGMNDVVKGCTNAKDQIWPVEDKKDEEGAYDIDGSGRPTGGDGVLYDAQMEMLGLGGAKKEAPAVKEWKGVGVL